MSSDINVHLDSGFKVARVEYARVVSNETFRTVSIQSGDTTVTFFADESFYDELAKVFKGSFKSATKKVVPEMVREEMEDES